MIPETDIFNVSGPSHITYVDWNCADYRRTVMACLVKGAYVLEQDRQRKLLGPKALAPPWWEFFHFQLRKVLVDSADSSIFGAILELKLPSTLPKGCSLNAPKYVIAFRGTLIKFGTALRDLQLDIQCVISTLYRSSRYKVAMLSIPETVGLGGGAANVWLAGHSLGSVIALLAGKDMAMMGYALPTYLFNCPFTSALFERINHSEIGEGFHNVSSFMKAVLFTALKYYHQTSDEQNDSFAVLSTWVPHLFVNPGDYISSPYKNYFAHREKMKRIGASKIGDIATKCTWTSLLQSATSDGISEPWHLLPSAELTENMYESSRFEENHGIRQWWVPHSQFQSSVYLYE